MRQVILGTLRAGSLRRVRANTNTSIEQDEIRNHLRLTARELLPLETQDAPQAETIFQEGAMQVQS